MATYPISIVDVFAEAPLEGNQLAVVHDAGELSTEVMQKIARETNFSETTFIESTASGRARVRIFTPAAELPFAGHPTLGTAWVLTRGQQDIVLELGLGPVPVHYMDGIGWMQPPEVTFSEGIDRATAASLVGVEEAQIDTEWPIERAEVGPRFVLIPVKDLATLQTLKIDEGVHEAVFRVGGGVCSVFVFAPLAKGSSADFGARMFFEAGGMREDPATGSANTAFAAYLRKHRGDIGRVIVNQGVEMGRPSRLYLQVEAPLVVGGKVQAVIEGELTL